MGSDRARVSYDASRQYRAVVAQQGRVRTEADENEAVAIAADHERHRTRQLVGRVGTPDDGYLVTPAAATFDVTIGAGTLYAGGLRVALGDDVQYSAQAEWRDRDGDPDWIPVDTAAPPGGPQELLWQELTEYEVSAVEDPVLREVALGGPDTTVRQRIVQRSKRFGTGQVRCEAALAELQAHWLSRGYVFDQDEMRLLPTPRLQVFFPPPAGGTAALCEPVAEDGYLGADNQLIRVQISAWNKGTGTGTIVWGYDAASYLYRAVVVDDKTLELRNLPPDVEHRPRIGQAVEVLRTAAVLDDEARIASAAGQVMTLAQPYDPDERLVHLPTAMPGAVQDPLRTPQVFLRVWEEQTPIIAGTLTPLAGTGLRVLLTGVGTAYPVGSFWLIGVRPETPRRVEPARLLDDGQPPDGPRTWVAPLAVLTRSGTRFTQSRQCRPPFEDLVTLTRRRIEPGCCDLAIRPEDLEDRSLQNVIDTAVQAFARPLTVCLRPGEYRLAEPLRLGSGHAGLTLKACPPGAVLGLAPGSPSALGVVLIEACDDVTICGLRVRPPDIEVDFGRHLVAHQAVAVAFKNVGRVTLGVGVRTLDSARLTLRDCTFELDGKPPGGAVVARIGVLAQGRVHGHQLTGCRFLGNRGQDQAPADAPAVAGWLATGASAPDPGGDLRLIRTIVEDLEVRDNRFVRCDLAVGVLAHAGRIRFTGNQLPGGLAVPQWHAGVIGLLVAPPWWLGGRQVLAKFPPDPVTQMLERLTHRYLSGGALLTAALARALEAPPWIFGVPFQPFLADQELANVVDEVAVMMGAAVTTGATWPTLSAAFPGGNPLQTWADLSDALADRERMTWSRPGRDLVVEHTVYVGGNEVVTSPSPTGRPAALLLIGVASRRVREELVLDGNRFDQGLTDDEPVVAAFGVERCAVTGNAVISDRGAPSLLLITGYPGGGGEGIALAGNSLRGRPIAPPRQLSAALPPLPPPLDDWATYNAVS